MVTVTAVHKYKHGKRIVGYQLVSDEGISRYVPVDNLKTLINTQQMYVTNLTLTKEGRFTNKRGKEYNKPLLIDQFKSETEFKQYIAKLRLLGRVQEFRPMLAEASSYLIQISEREYWLYIPDKVIDVMDAHEALLKITGTLRVIGGRDLIDTTDMFRACHISYLDLSRFHTENVEKMTGMFADLSTGALDLRSFKTNKVVYMDSMFDSCKASYIDLTTIRTQNVKSMHAMFRRCLAKGLDLSRFNTKNVTNMVDMFRGCAAKELILSKLFDTSNATDMHGMFANSTIRELDLSMFNINNVKSLSAMFAHCSAEKIDLSSFDFNRLSAQRVPSDSMLAGVNLKCLIVNQTAKQFVFELKNRQEYVGVAIREVKKEV